jgi:flagellin-like hook-associated protein FlgL
LNKSNTVKMLGSTPDTKSLADAARAGVVITANKDEAAGSAWVTQAQWDALDRAYTAAVAAAAKTGAAKKELADATSVLNSAITAFNSAKDRNGFEPINLPDALKLVIGKGYDITGSYAYSPEI